MARAREISPYANRQLMTHITNMRNVVNARDPQFGASPSATGSYNTGAIQYAIAAAEAGGAEVYIPAGVYPLAGTLTISTLTRLYGDGYRTTLQPTADLSSTEDVIYIHPAATGYGEFMYVGNMLIQPVSGTPGRHGIHIDVTESGRTVDNLIIENVYIRPLGGYGIYLTNPTNNDGFFSSTIRNNKIYGGIYLNRSGDTLRIQNNTITGDNGIYVDSVDGALSMLIMSNNITAAGGIHIYNGGQTKILYNQLELWETTTNTANAMIYLQGRSAYKLDKCEIVGNNLWTQGYANYCVYLDQAQNTTIDDNRMVRKTGQYHIGLTGDALENTIGGSNVYHVETDLLSRENKVVNDLGVGTMGVEKEASLENSWANYNASYSDAGFYKDAEQVVHLRGNISGGTTTNGTVLFTLPSNFRPVRICRFSAPNDSMGTLYHAMVQVETDGSVKIFHATGNTFLSLDGISFRTRGA